MPDITMLELSPKETEALRQLIEETESLTPELTAILDRLHALAESPAAAPSSTD